MADGIRELVTVAQTVQEEGEGPPLRRLLLSIQSIGFGAEIFPSAEDFLVSNNLDETSCIIVDVHMPVMTGLELQYRLNSSRCRIPMIFITAHNDPAVRVQAVKAGAVDFLSKPFDADALLSAIHVALDRKEDA